MVIGAVSELPPLTIDCGSVLGTTAESVVGKAPPAAALPDAWVEAAGVAAELDTTEESSVGNNGGALGAGVAELEATAGDGDSAFWGRLVGGVPLALSIAAC